MLFSLLRSITLALAAIGALLMAIVTMVAEKTTSPLAIAVAMPGLIGHLLITGGHGGTHLEETVGTCVAVIINACLGAAVFLLVSTILRHLKKKQLDLRSH